MLRMLDEHLDERIADLGVLAEPVRRRLYLTLVRRAEPMSRDEAAALVGIGRSLAAFHLDRLVAAGLLEAEFRRLGGKTGPGAGRPSKLYRASRRDLRAVVPERRYEVAAELFAEALSAPGRSRTELTDVARRYGTELGAEARRRAGARAGEHRRMGALQSVLRDAGYVPFEDAGELRMLNCPFDELAKRHRQLTCGMNLALLEGMLAGANLRPEAARIDRRPGLCCVAIGTARS
jgi:predicted ArsR family transcriptional regulator